MSDHPLYITTGDPNFHDLCGGRSSAGGIRIRHHESGIDPLSVVIAGVAGTGKTTLAIQLACKTLERNNKFVTANPKWGNDRIWPSNSMGIVYTLDQTPEEIAESIVNFGWLDRKDLLLVDGRQKVKSIRQGMTGLDKPPVLVIRAVPFEIDMAGLSALILTDTRDERLGGRVRLVVIDSVNTIRHKTNEREGYLSTFRKLLRPFAGPEEAINAEESDDRSNRFCTLLTLEIDPNAPLHEEYYPDCVIKLDRDRDAYGRRGIEIRKARQQEHLIGIHDMRIERSKGIRVFPSISSRAWQVESASRSRQAESRAESSKQPSGAVDKMASAAGEAGRSPEAERDLIQGSPTTKFGCDRVDNLLETERLIQGSSTLLWGEPGSGKTDLCVQFLAAGLEQNSSGVLLVTTKVDPTTFSDMLVKELQTRNSPENNRKKVADHLKIVEAMDPFRSHAVTFADVVDRCDDARQSEIPIKRAVVFGLGLLEENPLARDEQWRFISVLIAFLRSHDISTLVVDWPIEVSLHADHARPRASKLCANEIFTRSNPTTRKSEIEVTRWNHAAIPVRSNRISNKKKSK
ncbi:RAD55 family ATPase [Zavarzinella formosa]|uniref:RAD55 family ATPase n=1 Tax=Zavarzinella formosa TaxID=360055 RepID=UPI0002DF177E|nr:ATPase domain-containing protein [Zavarzinella formosa]